jgi:ketosteroid isomerase-like protein
MDRVTLVGRLFNGYQAGDFGMVADLMSPDVRLEPLSTDLEQGPVYEGLAGLAEWSRELERSPDEFQPAVETIEAVGERVLAIGSILIAHDDGLETVTTAWVFDFDAGDRLVRMRAFLDADAARSAASAPPSG